jgi:integrase
MLDRATFNLLWQSGLRSGEIGRLRQADLDLEAGRVRIEQSKGLKDRIVFLSQPAAEDRALLESNPSAAPATVQWGQSDFRSARCVYPLAPSGKR